MLKELVLRAWPGIVAAGVLVGLGAFAWTEKKEKDAAVAQSNKNEMEAKRIQSELDERTNALAKLKTEVERSQRSPAATKEAQERDSEVARQLAAMSQRIKEQDVKLDALQVERDQLKQALEQQRSRTETKPSIEPRLSGSPAPTPGPVSPVKVQRQQVELTKQKPVVLGDATTVTLNYVSNVGAEIRINGRNYPYHKPGSRLALESTGDEKCFLEVMAISAPQSEPQTARVDYVCQPRKL